MVKKDTHQFKLRAPASLKEALIKIARAKRRSLTAEILSRISHISGIGGFVDPPSEIDGAHTAEISLHIPLDLFKQIEYHADEKRIKINAEILRRLYWSDPLRALEHIEGRLPAPAVAEAPAPYVTRALSVQEIIILGKLFVEQWQGLYEREGTETQSAVMSQVCGSDIAHQMVSAQFKPESRPSDRATPKTRRKPDENRSKRR